MSIQNERQRIDGCDDFSVSAAFIAMEGAGYVRKKYVPTSEVSHLEIYQYICPSGAKATLVYDTVAKILTIDAPPSELAALRPMLPAGGKKDKSAQAAPQKRAEKPQGALVRVDKSQTALVKAEKPQKALVKADKPQGALVKADKPQSETRSERKKGAQAGESANAGREQGEGKRTTLLRDAPVPRSKPIRQQAKPAAQPKAAAETETLKGVSRKRLDWALKDMKTSDGIKVTAHMGGASWTVADGQKHTAELRFEGGAVKMTGVRSPLTALVRARLTSKCDMRLLRKYLSVSLRYLSEASRVDLSNGLTDFAGVSKLSDYSVLLVTPYRALEKLIYDLEQAEGINVKMIGQAYEKDDEGNYRLKKGYRKRINSVVYAEVMAALYEEYYRTRNFYTHSENAADSRSRGISDKAEAKRILDNLLSVIEYNCKKLSEINFSVEQD